jgi:hypothetical protein
MLPTLLGQVANPERASTVPRPTRDQTKDFLTSVAIWLGSFVFTTVLVTAVSHSSEPFLAAWWRNAWHLAVFGAVAVVVVGIVVVLYAPVMGKVRRTRDQFGRFIERFGLLVLVVCAVWQYAFLLSPPGRTRTIATAPEGGNALLGTFLTVWVGFFVGLVMVTPKHRDATFSKHKRLGWLAPLLIAGSFFICAVSLFAWVTVNFGVHFTGVRDPRDLAVRQIAGLYVWYFVKLLPFGNLPDVLKWSEPLHYTGLDVGLRVALFQVLVSVTTVATFRAYWKFRHSPGDTGEQPAETPDQSQPVGRARAPAPLRHPSQTAMPIRPLNGASRRRAAARQHPGANVVPTARRPSGQPGTVESDPRRPAGT